MLKAKRILRDLKHNLKGTKTIFGAYDSSNMKESKNLDISVLDVVRALAPYEIDFKGRYGVDFEDVIDEDAQGNYISIDTDIDSGNSYNWSSQITFAFNTVKVMDQYGETHIYKAIMFHRYGDVRGNYTDYMVLDMNDGEFCEVVADATRVSCSIDYKGNTYDISTDCFKEGCLFDIYNVTTGNDDYDVMLDIDNLRNKKDIKKALAEYLQQV
jgi:hypothetical protein